MALEGAVVRAGSSALDQVVAVLVAAAAGAAEKTLVSAGALAMVTLGTIVVVAAESDQGTEEEQREQPTHRREHSRDRAHGNRFGEYAEFVGKVAFPGLGASGVAARDSGDARKAEPELAPAARSGGARLRRRQVGLHRVRRADHVRE